MIALIIDDSPVDRKFLRIHFERRGWEVVEAGDGEEGLAAAKQSLPDLIVSDALMPRMDGFELLWQIRHSKLAATPFIIYTSIYLHEMDRVFTQELGADAFLLKSLQLDDFAREVGKVLDRRAQGETPQVTIDDDEFLQHYRDVLLHKISEK